MIKILKYFLFAFLFLDFNSQVQVQAKPVPPGSGEGDVPANILILIDSSASMSRRLSNRNSIEGVTNAVYDSNGDILVGQNRRLGVVKFGADGTRNRDYGGNAARWTGTWSDTCEAGLGSTAGYSNFVRNTTVRGTGKLRLVENLSTNDGTISNENILFFTTTISPLSGNVMGISEDGTDCRFYLDTGISAHAIDTFTIGGETHLLAIGSCEGNRRQRRNGCAVSFNLTRGERSPVINYGRRGTLASYVRNTWRISVNSDASIMYACRTHIRGFALQQNGNTYRLSGNGRTNSVRTYTAVNNGNVDTQLAPVLGCDLSPDDDDLIYVASNTRHVLQKVRMDTATTYTIEARAGTGARDLAMNTENSGELAASSVRFNQPRGVYVTSTRILVGSMSGTIDEFNEDLFTAANVDTAWLQQMGGGQVTRWTGVKQAMSAIVSDTTLTSGAHFGYGHWNAGETGGPRGRGRGGRWCHRNNGCMYYNGFNLQMNRSNLCNRDSCLNVPINAQGHRQILDELMPQGLAWGTDANAYSQIAQEYYMEGAPSRSIDPKDGSIVRHESYDPGSDCQLNYVIVIGDGMMNNNNPAATRIAQLKNLPNPVKTLFVAYGGGINARGMARFDQMAVAGSCPGGDSAHPDCEATIVANTPSELKTQLTSKIRQIIAEKLAFTAPSITATVQEGGSLYQAQFAYEQYGEWKGTILRKGLSDQGVVDHDPDGPGNWDAAVMIRSQSSAAGQGDTRNIWSAIAGADYIGNWDNFNVDNSDSISELFTYLNINVQDYHNTTSTCSTTSGVADGSEDDILGLINFAKGSDYFDYDGDCNITELRDHVLGDIYHSQLIEIGPPDASTNFTSSNEEAYFRASHNYQSFRALHAGRPKVIYAGSNAGMLHAICAEDSASCTGGTELWAFIPPFIASLMPEIVNPDYDGSVDSFKGGTNPIFGVDGSPVVHDVFIKGYDVGGDPEDTKNWHTVLFVPYGRGGAGFSILDVTEPQHPIHMVSIYNDSIGNRVLVADVEGNITQYTYSSGSMSVEQSLEGIQASTNLDDALTEDGGDDSDVTTVQDSIAVCQSNDDVTGGDFHSDGTASCYIGTTFTFEGLTPDAPDGINVPKSNLRVTERVNGTMQAIDFASAKYVDGQFVLTFDETKIFNKGGSDNETRASNNFNIATSCTSSSGITTRYDYSQLGETWSAPRIFRIPAEQIDVSVESTASTQEASLTTNTSDIVVKDDNYSGDDTYVAVMGAGMGNTNLCAGSAVFIINLDDNEDPGSIFGHATNQGPITIVDTEPTGTFGDAEGSDIHNSLPAAPVVITPDTAYNIPWRGALVYFNDLEGKITKINLTNSTKHGAQLFDQTTLFRLGANSANERYSYFSMDAGVGLTRNDFWLFGGTGDYINIGGASRWTDNILYGIKDPHYPYFKHLNLGDGIDDKIPRESDPDFLTKAHLGANKANSIDDADVCTNTTGKLVCYGEEAAAGIPEEEIADGPSSQQQAWVIHLDTVDGLAPNDPDTQNTHRKVSAPPTLFKGYVYFPVYQPPPGSNRCNIGEAYICVADDECGTNKSHLLGNASTNNASACEFVREGILSELVVFGDTLYANVAGPKLDEDTLYSVLSAAGEVRSSRGSWRGSGF